MATQSSLTLCSHFFLGLPLVRDPSVHPNNAICGNLSAGIWDTWPKYVSRRIRRSSVIYYSISNVFSMSAFHFLSHSLTPRIFLTTDISNTFNFHLCSSFSVHVRVIQQKWLNKRLVQAHFFVVLFMSSGFHIICNFLTIPAASPICLITSLSQLVSAKIVPPRYRKSLACCRSVLPNFMFIWWFLYMC